MYWYSAVAFVFFPSSANGAECDGSLELLYSDTLIVEIHESVCKRLIFREVEAQKVVVGAKRDCEEAL